MIDGNDAATSFHISHGDRILTFARAPSFTCSIKLWLTLLVGEGPSEVEQVNAVEFHMVIGVYIVVLTLQRQEVGVETVGLFSKMRPQMMLIEGILLQRVEDTNF